MDVATVVHVVPSDCILTNCCSSPLFSLRHLSLTACFPRSGGRWRPCVVEFASLPLRGLQRVKLSATEDSGIFEGAGITTNNWPLGGKVELW